MGDFWVCRPVEAHCYVVKQLCCPVGLCAEVWIFEASALLEHGIALAALSEVWSSLITRVIEDNRIM